MRLFKRAHALVGIALTCVWSGPVLAQSNTSEARAARVQKAPGTVFTFYGLRKLEQDPSVPDDEKLKEWRAFIERARKQIAYAERAVDRCKGAARQRVLDRARAFDQDLEQSPRDKIARWTEVARLYPKTPDARTAQRRVAHWTKEETKRLAIAAEEVERAKEPKVDRIKAWAAVLEWKTKGPEALAAKRRIQELQKQLYNEALSVDRIARVDTATKLDAWRDVLAGRPTATQERTAQKRVQALKAKLSAE